MAAPTAAALPFGDAPSNRGRRQRGGRSIPCASRGLYRGRDARPQAALGIVARRCSSARISRRPHRCESFSGLRGPGEHAEHRGSTPGHSYQQRTRRFDPGAQTREPGAQANGRWFKVVGELSHQTREQIREADRAPVTGLGRAPRLGSWGWVFRRGRGCRLGGKLWPGRNGRRWG